jgi:NAD(P)-dependent dehydrogenase (short-subunit alcohol dehydrogenase family)
MSHTAPLNLVGAVVVITGGAQGIGLETARRFAGTGANVVLIDADGRQLDRAVESIGRRCAMGMVADVRDPEALAAAVRQASTAFGRVDVIVANAGITPPTATLRNIELDTFRRVLDVNLVGALNTVRAGVDAVIASGGHIQLIGSCAAFSPGMGGAAYMISKAGVEQLGRALRIELAPHGVSVGISYFGIVETALARVTLDDDPIGKRIGGMLPWPLNRRISAGTAASSIVAAVRGRRATSVVPRTWLPYSWLRGIINPVLDRVLPRDSDVAEIVRQLDAPLDASGRP